LNQWYRPFSPLQVCLIRLEVAGPSRGPDLGLGLRSRDGGAQLGRELARRAEAVRPILGHGARESEPNPRRRAVDERLDALGRRVDVVEAHVGDRGRARERHGAAQELVGDQPEAVHVGPSVDPGHAVARALAPLLGRHVGGRSERRPRPREGACRAGREARLGERSGRARQIDDLRDTEVEHFDREPTAGALAHHDVLRLEVAVHDAM
jgi:hypothetical protein